MTARVYAGRVSYATEHADQAERRSATVTLGLLSETLFKSETKQLPVHHCAVGQKKVEFLEGRSIDHTQKRGLARIKQCPYHAAVKQQIIFIIPS